MNILNKTALSQIEPEHSLSSFLGSFGNLDQKVICANCWKIVVNEKGLCYYGQTKEPNILNVRHIGKKGANYFFFYLENYVTTFHFLQTLTLDEDSVSFFMKL